MGVGTGTNFEGPEGLLKAYLLVRRQKIVSVILHYMKTSLTYEGYGEINEDFISTGMLKISTRGGSL
jgi:hypothetical protein